jgi:hypothetical protein
MKELYHLNILHWHLIFEWDVTCPHASITRANVEDDREATVATFLNGLNRDIANAGEFATLHGVGGCAHSNKGGHFSY